MRAWASADSVETESKLRKAIGGENKIHAATFAPVCSRNRSSRLGLAVCVRVHTILLTILLCMPQDALVTLQLEKITHMIDISQAARQTNINKLNYL